MIPGSRLPPQAQPASRFLVGLAFATVFGALAATGWVFLFTTFMAYDDEGYLLITLRDYGREGGLYDQVYSQYGPFYYVFHDSLRRVFGFEWNHTTGRLATLGYWLGTAVLCALLVRRARGGTAAALITLAATFGLLWVNVFEPMHPGAGIAFIVALAAYGGFEALRAGHATAWGFVAGASAMALLLTKVNIGVFLGLAALGWLALDTGATGRRRRLVVVLGVAIPAALMHAFLSELWALTFVAVVGVASAGVVGATGANPTRPSLPGGRAWLGLLAGASAIGLPVVIVLLARETTFAGLWEGVIAGPLRHPGVYSFPVPWNPGTLVVAAGAAMLYWHLARVSPDDCRRTVAWLRLAVAAGFIAVFAAGFRSVFHSGALERLGISSLSFGLPLAGLFAWPLRRDDRDDNIGWVARAWPAALLALQGLHPFPVASSQVNWGVFLWIPVLVLGTGEALAVLAPVPPRRSSLGRVFAVAGLVGAGSTGLALAWIGGLNHHHGEKLGLPGAESLRLPAPSVTALRVVSENVRTHGSALLSLPGTYSLNLWSGVPPPTVANATHWFSLLRPIHQAEMLDRVRNDPQAMLVVQQSVMATTLQAGVRPAGPLIEHLRASFHRAFVIDDYAVWVKSGRTIAPLSTATLQAAGPDSTLYRLELTLGPQENAVAAVELWNLTGAQWLALRLDASAARPDLLPITADGGAAGTRRAADWPLRLDQLVRVGLEFRTRAPLPPAAGLQAVLLDGTGRRLGVARVLAPEALGRGVGVSAGAPPAGG